MWQGSYRKGDVESGATLLYPTMLESPELRWAFIRKIYSILTLQLLLTVAVAAVVITVRPISVFFATTGTGLALYIVLILMPFIVLCPLASYHQRHPVNYFLLGLFTISIAFAVGLTCAFTSGMDGVLLLCSYEQTNVAVRCHRGMTFTQLIDDICGKFDDLVRDVVYMLWDVPGYNKFKVDSDDDIENMFCLAESFALKHFDVLIQIRDVPKGGNYGGAYCREVHNFNFSNQTFGVDDQTDLLPTYCPNKTKTFLSAQWAFGITHVGQCFAGGVTEFREILCKYAVERGFQFKYLKNDSVRITAVFGGLVKQGTTVFGGVWTPVEVKSKCNSAGSGNVVTSEKKNDITHVLDHPGSEVVDRVIDFVNLEEPNITSLVRRVKSKARREWRLQDYEYPGLVKRCRQSKDDGDIVKIATEKVHNIEHDDGEIKTWAGFGMKNRYPVWKLLAEDEQKLLEVVYTFEGDGAVIWSAAEYGVRVNFKDIKSLVQGGGTAGNVIDAYAEILKSEQNVAAVSCANFSKSYFHSSVCSDMMRNRSVTSKDSYMNVHVNAAFGCRYVHYPIYHANHWTIMVYDSDSGTWTHYNSIKPRKGSRDDHFAEAVKVKQWVVDYAKRMQGKVQSIAGVRAENIDGPLEALGDCPQQHPESLDCAIMVCFIMRQYANNVEVEGSMDGMTASAFRAEMAKAFINDPHRGLRNRPLP